LDIKELRDLMEHDDLELVTLEEQKTALFVIISDTDAVFVRIDRAFCNLELSFPFYPRRHCL